MIAMEWFAVYERDAIEVKKNEAKSRKIFFLNKLNRIFL